MVKWLENFTDANPQTKYFVFTWILYGAFIVISTLYCYARLDYVRSYKTPPTQQTVAASKKS